MIGGTYKICPTCGVRAGPHSRYCPACAHDLSQVEDASGDPYVGLVLADKYVVEQLIGEGAMGRVYKAKQLTLGKPFAVKILAPHLMNHEASHLRFANEAHNAASLNHPNCVSVLDYGRSPEGVTYIVMDYVHGSTLEHLIAQHHPLPRDRVVDLVLQILAALTEAHGLGILHRDLKPENILVQQLRTHGELAKVLDFGIAKLMEEQASAGTGLTSQGMVCGTPEYMSPEQARGQKLDARSDLYAVGVILYQMLTGKPPFESASAVEVLYKHLHEQPLPPSKLMGVDPDPLEAVCLRAMAKSPGDRYESAQAFREALIVSTSSHAGASQCNRCSCEVRAEHRFCPSCGAPAPNQRRDPNRRRTAPNGSGMVLPSSGEPTAEVVVRNFPLPLSGREVLFEQARLWFSRPKPAVTVRVMAGPAGIGKTRICDEMASLAESMGWRSYYVGADPTGARTPLWPVQCMVAQLLDFDPSTVSTQDLGRVANLTGLAFEELPGLAELFELVGPAHELELAVRRRECYASAVQAMLMGGRGTPLVLIFDDIDAFDTPSREILGRLAASISAAPVLVLCMSAEPDLSWLGGSVERLEPLDADVVERLGRRVTTEVDPTSSLPEALAAAAPLTPLKLENHLRLVATGVQAPSDASAEALLAIRLQRLTPVGERVVQLASVLGVRFLERDLVEMYEHDGGNAASPEFDQALGHLHVAGIVVVISNGERAFTHALLHAVVYATIPIGRRRTLHNLASMTARQARNSEVVRAVHLVRARAPEAIEALVGAARRAERNFDDPAAADFLRFALETGAQRTGGHLPIAQEVELTLQAARVMRSQAAIPTAIALLRAAAEKSLPPTDEARVLAALGGVLGRAHRYDEATTVLNKALGVAISAGERSTMVTIYYELGHVHTRSQRVAEAISELSEGLDMFTLGEGPRAAVELDLWRYLVRLCEICRVAKRHKESREWCEHALFQAERRGDRLGVLRCHSQMAWVLRDLRQMALAEQHLARALDEARHFGDRLTTAELLIERARARASRGRLTEASRCCEEALRLAQGIQWSTGVKHAKRAIAMLKRDEPPPPSVAPAENSGSFVRPGSIQG